MNEKVCPRCKKTAEFHRHWKGHTICEDGIATCNHYPYNNNFIEQDKGEKDEK